MNVKDALKFIELSSVLKREYKQPRFSVYFGEVTFRTLTAYYDTCNLMAFVHRRDLGGTYFSIKIGTTGNV